MGLICGTLYVYSSYSPQLAQRLGYSATNASVVALAGNLAVALTGPFAGVVVDKRGYSIPLFLGAVGLLVGYLGLRAQYIALHGVVFVLAACLFLAGSGLTCLFLVCLKCCAVTFPQQRGMATALPSAMYGLLAMFYSVVASSYYAGDTQGFLLFLPVSVAVIFTVCAPLIIMSEPRRLAATPRVVLVLQPIELKPMGSPVVPLGRNSAYDTVGHTHEPLLLLSPRFWLLFVITGAMASIGQMYIYSVGYMVKALIASQYDVAGDLERFPEIEPFLQNEQLFQVAILSFANCSGRLIAGFLGDFVRQKLRKPRSWLLFIPGVGFTIAQFMAHSISDYHKLKYVSVLSGSMYGFTFCILPIIVGDVFGIEDFSRNWGLLGLAPLIPSNLFTTLFGVIYDFNSFTTEFGLHLCLMGKHCYELVFRMSLAVAIVALVVVFIFNFADSYLSSRTIFGQRLLVHV